MIVLANFVARSCSPQGVSLSVLKRNVCNLINVCVCIRTIVKPLWQLPPSEAKNPPTFPEQKMEPLNCPKYPLLRDILGNLRDILGNLRATFLQSWVIFAFFCVLGVVGHRGFTIVLTFAFGLCLRFKRRFSKTCVTEEGTEWRPRKRLQFRACLAIGPAPHRVSGVPSGPRTPEESEKSPERVPRGRAPKVPKECAPESQKSPKRVQNLTFGLFSDSFGTPGRTLSGLLGPCPGVLFRDSFRTLPGFSGPKGPGDPVWGGATCKAWRGQEETLRVCPRDLEVPSRPGFAFRSLAYKKRAVQRLRCADREEQCDFVEDLLRS